MHARGSGHRHSSFYSAQHSPTHHSAQQHERQILSEVPLTHQKLESNLQRLSRQMANKASLEKYFTSLAPSLHHSRSNPTSLPKVAQQDDLGKLDAKVRRLKKRIFSKGKSVQNKLSEIIYIKEAAQTKYRQRAAAKHRPNLYSPDQIVQKYWAELEKDSRVSAAALQKIRNNRLHILVRQSGDEEEAQHFHHLTHQLLSNLPRATHTQTLHQPSPTQQMHCELTRYLQSRNQKQNFLQGLTPETVERESAHRLYCFIRGGYALDPSDVEGEYISLQRFNQAKEEFATLGELYRWVLGEGRGGAGEGSFGSLVRINELSGKVGPSQLLRAMKQSKVVR